jgi:hypothetical protein
MLISDDFGGGSIDNDLYFRFFVEEVDVVFGQ